MFIERDAALHFIEGNQRLLAMVVSQPAESLDLKDLTGLALLAQARQLIVDDPTRLRLAAAALVKNEQAIADDVLQAVESLQLKQWVYLRDTTKYSVLIDPEAEKAYAVLGLTQSLKTVLGGSGLVIGTGVMAYRGQYVCDGIFSGQPVWLGPGYKSSFSDNFADIKKRKYFYKMPGLA